MGSSVENRIPASCSHSDTIKYLVGISTEQAGCTTVCACDAGYKGGKCLWTAVFWAVVQTYLYTRHAEKGIDVYTVNSILGMNQSWGCVARHVLFRSGGKTQSKILEPRISKLEWAP